MLASPLTLLTAFLPLLALTQAHSIQPPHLRHRRMAANSLRDIAHEHEQPAARAQAAPRANAGHAEAKRAIKKSVKKRGQQCRPRGSKYTPSATSSAAAETASESSSSSSSDAASSTDAATTSLSNDQAWAPHVASTTSSSADDWWSASTTSSSAAEWSETSSSAAASPTSGNSGGGIVNGLLSITDSTCGYSNADSNSPNGAESWLNCGLDGSGWTPPMVTVDQLVGADLTTDGVFAPCASYVDQFNKYANQYGLKGIMLASFAMQESTCNPSVTGGNGEAGLMQLTKENCGGAPGGNCYDVDFNIQRAAELFSNMISANGGNVLLSIGSYNGQGRCAAQNNLDYIHQFCNGWMQNKSGYELGTYFNLANC
ncbi:hypothetical protein IAT38_001915 [Cryptococcus sp. DSM 104549]